MSSKENLNLKKNKNCLNVAQLENKINHLEKNEIDADSLKKDHKEFIKNNKLILKTQQWFQSDRHNVFTKNSSCKTALSSKECNQLIR